MLSPLLLGAPFGGASYAGAHAPPPCACYSPRRAAPSSDASPSRFQPYGRHAACSLTAGPRPRLLHNAFASARPCTFTGPSCAPTMRLCPLAALFSRRACGEPHHRLVSLIPMYAPCLLPSLSLPCLFMHAEGVPLAPALRLSAGCWHMSAPPPSARRRLHDSPACARHAGTNLNISSPGNLLA